MKTKGSAEIVRTSLELPEDLWRRVKQRALDERTDFRSLVIEGLELRLRQRTRGKKILPEEGSR